MAQSQLTESAKEAAKDIGASVERLEKLFDKLYEGTFSIMRDTVSDMRKHIWPEGPSEVDKIGEEAERKADEKMQELKQSIDSDISRVLEQQNMQHAENSMLRHEMQGIIQRAMESSRQAENDAREETLREHINKAIRKLDRRGHPVRAAKLVDLIEFPGHEVIEELDKMRDESLITYSDEALDADTIIEIHLPANLNRIANRRTMGRLYRELELQNPLNFSIEQHGKIVRGLVSWAAEHPPGTKEDLLSDPEFMEFMNAAAGVPAEFDDRDEFRLAVARIIPTLDIWY